MYANSGSAKKPRTMCGSRWSRRSRPVTTAVICSGPLTAAGAAPSCVTFCQTHSSGLSELPWVAWRLVLLDSHPGGVGPLGSVERCFVLRGRDVLAVPVQPALVEPVHPGQRREFERVDVVPAAGVRSGDAL